MRGKFLVFEGTDGSGKATQVKLLSDYLVAQKVPHEVIAFPRYTYNKYGKQIAKYLKGQLKKDPQELALLFAEDRKLAKPKIEKWLRIGKIVIADRYVSSSKAHLSATMAAARRPEFIRWLDNLEYKENQVPREDLTIFLYVPAEVAKDNIEARGRKQDLHEKDLAHLKTSNQVYQELAKKEKNWIIIDCTKDGQMRSKEDIHQEIVDKLASII
jgi:dTMP kinase